MSDIRDETMLRSNYAGCFNGSLRKTAREKPRSISKKRRRIEAVIGAGQPQ
jgi:organic hydroperoxide reductase OsmC/OhrA